MRRAALGGIPAVFCPAFIRRSAPRPRIGPSTLRLINPPRIEPTPPTPVSHRGAHPEDPDQFGIDEVGRLQKAVRDLSWLRSRGYGENSIRKLVGDHYRLKRRQRNAVIRSAATDAEVRTRSESRCSIEELEGETVHVDGFNVLITVEGALGGAYLFVGRDGALRDVDPIRGSYRTVEETQPAVEHIGQLLQGAGATGVVWHLDEQMSNVGRLVTRLWHAAETNGWPWMVEVKEDVDAALVEAGESGVVTTSDSGILDAVSCWINLPGAVVRRHGLDANVRNLRPGGDRPPPDR